MNRRGFLATLAAAFVADPERLLWVPGRKLISIPPKPLYPGGGNRILTISEITNEMLKVLGHNLKLSTRSVNRMYDADFVGVVPKIGDTITVRKPQRFLA